MVRYHGIFSIVTFRLRCVVVLLASKVEISMSEELSELVSHENESGVIKALNKKDVVIYWRKINPGGKKLTGLVFFFGCKTVLACPCKGLTSDE
ncbi:hypothetical protein OS493_038171 [Desmophyllum pertusum]|uniref:Uncharacterized protein n=1 Tax=Desmophyllum pertusum TaxID=174260 RepID=A0A9X0D7E9_9CNID|nr:hypothetical protein OS493_038171 [Desmophyllum pertusum]